jgi:predicted molibdopterin-dependent oxidoreductase YjgC
MATGSGSAPGRGELEGRALVTEMVRQGDIFVPFVKLAKHAANFLTNAALDPNSKIPEYKVCAVRFEKADEGLEAPVRRRGIGAWRKRATSSSSAPPRPRP